MGWASRTSPFSNTSDGPRAGSVEGLRESEGYHRRRIFVEGHCLGRIGEGAAKDWPGSEALVMSTADEVMIGSVTGTTRTSGITGKERVEFVPRAAWRGEIASG
jgi:hypothetical protein